MPTLRVVPDPQDDPGALALAAVAPELATTSNILVPLRWFPCVDAGVGAAVRAHVLTSLNVSALDTDILADAMVLVSELVTNVRDHTASDTLGVRVRVTADRVVVAVVEREPSDAPAGGRLVPGPSDGGEHVHPASDRGRGLHILDAMASEWGFVRSGGVTTVWFALPAERPVAPGPPPEIRRF